MITGTFKTTASTFLDYHADLLPIELRLNQSVHRAAARLATLPSSHPLHQAICRCSTSYPRFHRSPLHELFHSFPDLCLLSPLSDSPPLPPDQSSLEIVTAASKEEAREHTTAALQGWDTVPDRALVTALSTQPSHPLVRLFLRRFASIKRHARTSLHLRILWAPGSATDTLEHARCQARDDAALAAAGHESLVTPALSGSTLTALHTLGDQRPVLLKRYDEQVHAQWTALWEQLPQGRRFQRAIDPAPPGRIAAKVYRGLSRRQCSILSQLRSGHAGLNRFLARIGAVDSPLCATCRVPESISHYHLTCRRFIAARHTLRQAVKGPLLLRSTLGDTKV